MRRPAWHDYLLLLALGAIWGTSVTLIKVAVATIAPLTVAAGRIALAAVVLTAIVAVGARTAGLASFRRRDVWLVCLGIGVIGNCLPFFLISWGEQHIDSALAAALMAVMPLATLLLAHFYTTDERLTWRRAAGIGIGFAGTVVLIGPGALAGLGQDVLRQLAVAGGALCYAIATILTRRASAVPSRHLAAGVMLAAAAAIVPPAVVLDPTFSAVSSAGASLGSVAAVVVLGLVSTALAMLLVLRLIRRCGAVFMSFTNYLVPVFGISSGMIFLGESLATDALVGFALILAGIAVATLPARRNFS